MRQGFIDREKKEKEKQKGAGMAEATAILPFKEERKTGNIHLGIIVIHDRRITKEEWQQIWVDEPDIHLGHIAMCPF